MIKNTELLRGRIALKQMRCVQRLLTEAGVPDTVEVGDVISNGPELRLKWFLLRRKDVQKYEHDAGELTKAEIEQIKLLVPFGKSLAGKEGE